MAEHKLLSGSIHSPSKSIPIGSITFNNNILLHFSTKELEWLYGMTSRNISASTTDFNTFANNVNWGYASLPTADILYKGKWMNDLSYPFGKVENRDIWYPIFNDVFPPPHNNGEIQRISSQIAICVMHKADNTWRIFSPDTVGITYRSTATSKCGVIITQHELVDIDSIYFVVDNKPVGIGFTKTAIAKYHRLTLNGESLYVFDFNNLVLTLPPIVQVVARAFVKEKEKFDNS